MTRCCTYYIKNRQRQCRFPVQSVDSLFCSVHAAGRDDRKRIPCCIDPAHSIYAHQTTSHLRKCTKTRDISWTFCQPFVVEDINHPAPTETITVVQEKTENRTELELTSSSASAKEDDSQHSLSPLTFKEFEENDLRHSGPQCLIEKPCTLDLPLANEDLQNISSSLDMFYKKACDFIQSPYTYFLDGILKQGTFSTSVNNKNEATAITDKSSIDSTSNNVMSNIHSSKNSHFPEPRDVYKRVFQENESFRNAILATSFQASNQRQHLSSEVKGFPILYDDNSVNIDGMPVGCLVLDKHDQQNAMLLALAVDNGYLNYSKPQNLLCIEFGAGRGELTRFFVLGTAHGEHTTRFVLVDREKRRNRAEAKDADLFTDHKRSQSILRIRADVRDFDLGGVLKFIMLNDQQALYTQQKPPRILRFLAHHDAVNLTQDDDENGNNASWKNLLLRFARGGGPPIEEIQNLVNMHFNNQCVFNIDDEVKRLEVICVAKHLCGGGTDASIRCVVNAISSLRKEIERSPCTRFQLVFHLIIAPCCHHRCNWSSTLGKTFLETFGISPEQLDYFASMSGWGTGARGVKQEIGLKAKRIIDIARVSWLQDHGFTDAKLVKFVDGYPITLENVAIVGSCEVCI